MSSAKIFGEGLFKIEFITSKITLYAVTKENLKGIKKDNLLADILFFIASLFGGAFFSTLITIEATKTSMNENAVSLTPYKNIFLIVAILFFVISVILKCITSNSINNITKTEITLSDNNNEY